MDGVLNDVTDDRGKCTDMDGVLNDITDDRG